MNMSQQECLKSLEEQFQNGEFKYENFKKCFDELKNAQNQLQNMLKHASEIKKDEKKFDELYRRLAGENASELIERLRTLGFALKKNKNLEKAFESAGYRLLEQARAGKRDDVYYGILRIFVANNRKFPNDLAEVFKPIYSEGMFKVFVFSFLSGLIGKVSDSEKTMEGD